eukprot:CAMPEP_0179323814 /NCGR_PEP_ID=MMETSP0797-20121207/59931_1 /TAXON_ID=47934 /ORGANISM="Dinophysis acuminata, Strain DAEP01" /LENGTH=38 /DNA_ID= /DNA_START= /DNA_END= /DNA_ORIENTATION=
MAAGNNLRSVLSDLVLLVAMSGVREKSMLAMPTGGRPT